MMWKVTRCRVVFAVLAVPLLFPAVCFVDSLRYPRIARSAYWHHPNLLVRATAARLFPGKGVSKKAVIAHARQLGRMDNLNVRLLYLPDLPAYDKTIKARTFHMIVKRWGSSKEKLFWVVTPRRDCRNINDDKLAYEYRTGRLVCAKEYSRIGEFALNK